VLVMYFLAQGAAHLPAVIGHVDMSVEFQDVCQLLKRANSWQQLRRG
jgi:hypothetical protein